MDQGHLILFSFIVVTAYYGVRPGASVVMTLVADTKDIGGKGLLQAVEDS